MSLSLKACTLALLKVNNGNCTKIAGLVYHSAMQLQVVICCTKVRTESYFAAEQSLLQLVSQDRGSLALRKLHNVKVPFGDPEWVELSCCV